MLLWLLILLVVTAGCSISFAAAVVGGVAVVAAVAVVAVVAAVAFDQHG